LQIKTATFRSELRGKVFQYWSLKSLNEHSILNFMWSEIVLENVCFFILSSLNIPEFF